MTRTYVAIDVETTGLDANRDVIIEVAVITFQGNTILDEFQSLVNPHRDLPREITRITSITQDMVEDAPTMFKLRPRIRTALGDHVLVGHNVDFDLGFLRAERLGTGNHRLDTLTLASILLPEAGRYGLEALARFLNLPRLGAGQTHRAGDDAELTIELFLALRERALALPMAQMEELVLAGRNLSWPETLFFQDVLAERAKKAFEGDELRKRGRLPRLYKPPKLDGQSPTPKEPPEEIDVDAVAGMIRPGGNFSHVFKGFEYRPQQVEMLEAVADAFNGGDHVLVEAGTGTGKSVGYLLPAVFWAHVNGRRVVISTNTINLQDQLINKDIPEMQKTIPFEVRAAVRKGRSNYICTRLFQQMRRSGPSNTDEMVMYARILLWLPHTLTGDLAELTLRSPAERMIWSRMNGDNGVCTGEHCAAEKCPLYVARTRAEQAHIIIVNHALLLSDVANENHILPHFVDLIVDEAHHFESAVTSGLSFRADKRFLETTLDEIVKPSSGLVGDTQRRIRAELTPAISSEVDSIANRLRENGELAAHRLDEFFMGLDYFLQEHKRKGSQFAQQIRITPAVRYQPDYSEMEINWDNFNKQLQTILKGFVALIKALDAVLDGPGLDGGEELRAAIATSARDLEEARKNINAMISEPADDTIYWVEIFRDRLSLHSAPLHIGPLVEEHIFGAKETVILTSATMQTAVPGQRESSSFDYISDRLHAHDTNRLAVGSPFDYKNATLLYLVSDIPEPSQPGYQQYVEAAIIDVAQALDGRTMVLFTSYSQLKLTARGIESSLAAKGITVLAQSSGSSRQQLLAQFKQENSRSVLLGTRSFWEGVDVPGPALQALMITKIPFDVPSDPVFAARSETFDNSFYEYSIPEAVLRFRQGFGRLIRRKDDEGVVVVLDKRVLTKRYGQAFIDALPECTVLRQRNGRLGEITLRWLNRER